MLYLQSSIDRVKSAQPLGVPTDKKNSVALEWNLQDHC